MSYNLKVIRDRNFPKMKVLKILSIFMLISVATTEIIAQQSLSIGSNAPMMDHDVEDVNGRSLSISGSAEQNGLIVIFSCNTCPMVSMWEDRMKALANSARLNNVGMIVLNPNERIRDRGESLEDMKRRSIKQTYNFVYALDKDHILADAFGATKTPEVFVFDGSMKLVYKGSIDDNPNNPSGVTKRYVEDAVQALASGNPVEVSRSVPKGCPIKRNE